MPELYSNYKAERERERGTFFIRDLLYFISYLRTLKWKLLRATSLALNLRGVVAKSVL